MSFEEVAGRRVRLQHSLDPLAQVRVLATPLGEVRGPLIGRELTGRIEEFLFAISVCAHDTKSVSTKDYAFFPLETVKIGSGRQDFLIASKRGIILELRWCLWMSAIHPTACQRTPCNCGPWSLA